MEEEGDEKGEGNPWLSPFTSLSFVSLRTPTGSGERTREREREFSFVRAEEREKKILAGGQIKGKFDFSCVRSCFFFPFPHGYPFCLGEFEVPLRDFVTSLGKIS